MSANSSYNPSLERKGYTVIDHDPFSKVSKMATLHSVSFPGISFNAE
jgi:hypothetical protein